MKSKEFDPGKIGMKICPHCNGYGRKYGAVCSECGGFGYLKKDGKAFSGTSSVSEVPKLSSPSFLTGEKTSEGGGDFEIP